MKLSVIIPSYNFSPYIKECVDSVLLQKTSFDFEIIVGDDFSRDDTWKILKNEYGDNNRVRLFSSDENLGPFKNIKKLLNEAKGEYISLLDGDDFFTDPEKLQKQIDFLENNLDFFMHCTGYRSLTPDKKILPSGLDENWWYTPLRPVVTTSDLLEANFVTFGRTFRKDSNLLKSWMENCPYLDWAFNFESSLRGKIRCESWPSGIYRHSERGMFSLKSNEEKMKMNHICIDIFKKRIKELEKKITIIDCFVRNPRIEEKLKIAIEKLKSRGEEILLISNMPPDSEIIKMCDFFIYDKRNQLFQSDYTNVKVVDFHINLGEFSVHNLKPGLQRHGLSVLINLTTSLSLAREMGYRYFQRIEVDDIFGELSLNKMDEIFSDCIDLKKKACFYFNVNEKNVSFHYFLSEIEFFLNKIPKINSEEDFREYLISSRGNYDFMIAEEFIYQSIEGFSTEILIKDGGQMFLDFPDTSWNTETSGSNVDPKYKECLTGIYKVIDSSGGLTGYAVMSYNYGKDKIRRRIVYKSEIKEDIEILHTLECLGAWSYNLMPQEYDRIEVYEGPELIFIEGKDKTISYLQF